MYIGYLSISKNKSYFLCTFFLKIVSWSIKSRFSAISFPMSACAAEKFLETIKTKRIINKSIHLEETPSFEMRYLIGDNLKKNKEKQQEKKYIRIFGENFVKNNKNKCKIIYKNKIYDLKEYFEEIDDNYNREAKEIKLKLIFWENITDMSYMFEGCSQLKSMSEYSKGNKNIIITELRDNISDNYFNKCEQEETRVNSKILEDNNEK